MADDMGLGKTLVCICASGNPDNIMRRVESLCCSHQPDASVCYQSCSTYFMLRTLHMAATQCSAAS